MTHAQHSVDSTKRQLPRGGSIAIGLVSIALLSGWIVGPPAARSADLEKRPPVELPEITTETVLKTGTYRQFEGWAMDHLRIKPVAVEGINNAVASLLQQSGSSLVIQGKALNGARGPELFLAEEFTARCEFPADITIARKALDLVRETAQEHNKDVHFYVVPSKIDVLGHLLGNKYKDLVSCADAENAVIDQLSLEYPEIIRIVTPESVVSYAPRDPFWEADSHWTPMGGRALSEMIIADIANVTRAEAKELLLQRTRISSRAPLQRGELFRFLGREDTTSAFQVVAQRGYGIKSVVRPFGVTSPGKGWVSANPVPGADKSVVIIHDSMVNVPRLTLQFGNVVPVGYDIHNRVAMQINKLPATETLLYESVNRTFLSKLRRFPGVDPSVPDEPQFVEMIEYLRK